MAKTFGQKQAIGQAARQDMMAASSGMVATESRVERKVPWVMAVSSRPYFMQNIVPNEATGIPMSTALMEAMCLSAPSAVAR